MKRINSHDSDREVDDTFRHIVVSQLANAPVADPWEAIAARATPADGTSRSNGLVLFASVGALVMLLVGSVVVLANRDTNSGGDGGPGTAAGTSGPGTALVPAIERRSLSDVEDLGDGEWAYPGWMPEDVTFRYANEDRRNDALGADDRWVVFRAAALGAEEYVISLLADDAEQAGDLVTINGRDWYIDISSTGSSATRKLDTHIVEVWGPTTDRSTIEQIVGGLDVRSTGELPSAPFDDSQLTEVASAELDNRTVTLAVAKSNDYYCVVLRSRGGTGGCVEPHQETTEPISAVAQSTAMVAYPGQDTIAHASVGGLVNNDVARLEVEFDAGHIVRVQPVAHSQFDVRFFVATAAIPVSIDDQFDAAIDDAEVRAYDSDDVLIATYQFGS